MSKENVIEIDAVGVHTPIPLLRMHKAALKASKDDILKVVYTDKGTVMDLEAYSTQTDANFELFKNEIVEGDNVEELYHSYMRHKR